MIACFFPSTITTYFTYIGIPAAFHNNAYMLQFSLRTLGPDFISPVGLGY